MEEKASKNWVKSNFETLDKQIRDAMAKMIEREEAVKMVSDLNVEDKLDRIELQPFKDYVGKCKSKSSSLVRQRHQTVLLRVFQY